MLMLKKPTEHPYREVLQERGITQQELALTLGISQSKVSQILAGWIKPSDKIQKMLDELLRGIARSPRRKVA